MSQIYSIAFLFTLAVAITACLAWRYYYVQARDLHAMWDDEAEFGAYYYRMFQDANDALAEACADLHAAQYEVEELKSLVDRVWRGKYDMPDCEYIAQISESAARRRHPSYTEDVPF